MGASAVAAAVVSCVAAVAVAVSGSLDTVVSVVATDDVCAGSSEDMAGQEDGGREAGARE